MQQDIHLAFNRPIPLNNQQCLRYNAQKLEILPWFCPGSHNATFSLKKKEKKVESRKYHMYNKEPPLTNIHVFSGKR